jgi:endo-1,4-beta-xylanase
MMDWTRRTTLAGFGGMLISAAAGVPVGATVKHEPGLGEIAAQKGLRFGSAMMVDELAPASQELFAREVRAITPSNELKLPEVRPTAEVVDFSGADQLIAFAESHHLPIRGHTLIWNEWQPDWVNALSPPAVERLIDEHIERVCGRYAGRIFCWDVVNEPLATEDSDTDWLSHGPFFDALGEKYIGQSLARARAAAARRHRSAGPSRPLGSVPAR